MSARTTWTCDSCGACVQVDGLSRAPGWSRLEVRGSVGAVRVCDLCGDCTTRALRNAPPTTGGAIAVESVKLGPATSGGAS